MEHNAPQIIDTSTNPIEEAFLIGINACHILANECSDQDDEKSAEIWRVKAIKIRHAATIYITGTPGAL